jgi:hypothetical protein
VGDAFDGKILWLLLNEEEVRGRYQYGTEPPAETKKGSKKEEHTSEFERFKQTTQGQKINYRPDFNKNILVIENYNNIRDLHNSNISSNGKRVDSETLPESHILTTGGEHSIFTYYLLQGLRGNTESVDNEGNVTPQSLARYDYRTIMSLPRCMSTRYSRTNTMNNTY